MREKQRKREVFLWKWHTVGRKLMLRHLRTFNLKESSIPFLRNKASHMLNFVMITKKLLSFDYRHKRDWLPVSVIGSLM